jgi:hypothetical protein
MHFVCPVARRSACRSGATQNSEGRDGSLPGWAVHLPSRTLRETCGTQMSHGPHKKKARARWAFVNAVAIPERSAISMLYADHPQHRSSYVPHPRVRWSSHCHSISNLHTRSIRAIVDQGDTLDSEGSALKTYDVVCRGRLLGDCHQCALVLRRRSL